MSTKRKKRTSLPRVTMLAMSRAELERFSSAAEQVCGLAHLMVGLMTRLDHCVSRLEARSAAAQKAHRTRQAAAVQPQQQQADDDQTGAELPPVES